MVATYRGVHWGDEAGYAVDPLPKEQFIYHTAGQDGHGSASYIHAAVLRQRDTSTAWPEAPANPPGDGQGGNPPSPPSATTATFGPAERVYYLQNWRADVVAIVAGANVNAGGYQAAVGAILERITYSPYGVPRVAGAANYNLDTVVNPDDLGDYITEYAAFTEATPPGAGMSDAKWVLLDVNADGSIDSDDLGDFITCYFADDGTPQGPGVLSSISVANRKGYAGYEYDPELSSDQVSMHHVRHRVYDAASGRWTRRDPLGYVDGMGLTEYTAGQPLTHTDASGLHCDNQTCVAAGAAIRPAVPAWPDLFPDRFPVPKQLLPALCAPVSIPTAVCVVLIIGGGALVVCDAALNQPTMPGQMCDERVRKCLQLGVNADCKTPGKRTSCDGGARRMPCSQLLAIYNRAVSCAASRKALQDECFGGFGKRRPTPGDVGHMGQFNERRENALGCWRKMHMRPECRSQLAEARPWEVNSRIYEWSRRFRRSCRDVAPHLYPGSVW